MIDALFTWVRRYERHLSTLVFLGGFVTDLLTFTLLDIRSVNLLFIAYLGIAAVLALLTLVFREYADGGPLLRRAIAVLAPLFMQFTIGSMLSGFLIFYTMSAVLSVSWPFILLLVAIFFGNELFRSYRAHIVFQTLLFFFTLYAYCIFALPLYMNRLGPSVFLMSSGVTVAIFALFIALVALAAPGALHSTLKWILLGSGSVLATVMLLYFSGLVPPIPLTLKDAGVYHKVTRVPDGYQVSYEKKPLWRIEAIQGDTLHHVPGTPLYAFSSIFAPSAFSASVVHRWERYDEARGVWVTESVVAFALSGGRAGGYRGYTEKENPAPGRWRVSIETPEGQVIGNLAFTVVNTDTPPQLYVKTQ